MKIGIDIGNVIIGGGGEDTFFTEKFMETPEVEGAWSAIWALARAGREIHIISKCGQTTEFRSMKWLDSKEFSKLLLPQRIHFVRKRHLKAPMAQALELDIFIDDREDVLEHMEGTVPHLILFTSWEQTNKELEKIFDGSTKG